MASPSNMSPWPGVTEPLSFPAPAANTPENITDSELILIRVREQIATGAQDTDVLLGAIAVSAQAITDATGAALGIRRDGAVTCVGRSGETAPGLGARLSEEYGISGECLRTGRNQRCDDTETDSRVDVEVCRHLGLRSIAAVPIRSRLETIGILEVFSTSANAFTEEHMSRLCNLAELADAASSAARPEASAEHPAFTYEPLRPDLPILNSPWEHSGSHHRHIWRYVAVACAVVVLGLVSFASWKMWNDLSNRRAGAPGLATVATSSPVRPTPAQSGFASKPMPEQIASTQPAKTGQKSRGVVQASNVETEPDDGLIRTIPAEPQPSESQARDEPVENDTTSNTPPQVSMVTTNADSLGGLMVPSASLPQLEIKHSEGVSPVVLERKVMPSYPQQALVIRREGAVVMRATISDQGQVSQVKLLSGDAILGKAAMDAVRQWRYHPALLNGKPTPSETDITLNFKLP